MTNATKATLSDIKKILGDDPISAISELQAKAERLSYIEGLLPDILHRGVTQTLRELPATAEPSGLQWNAMSNIQLAGEKGTSAAFEKLRRSLAGIQRHNQAVEPKDYIYPANDVLARLADIDGALAQSWARNPYISREISQYHDDLVSEFDKFRDQWAQKMSAVDPNDDSFIDPDNLESIRRQRDAKPRKYIQWPAEYGKSAW